MEKKINLHKIKNIKLNKKTLIVLLCLVVVVVAIIKGLLFVAEYKSIPDPPDDDISYPVRGVDISHYQGDVDWPTLADQNLAFAFIKATEGSSHVDSKFEYNWEEAHKTHLKVGAYHFMSFETSAKKQAANFIKNVPKTRGMLPPVVDVELYGDFIKTHPSEDTVKEILMPLLEILEEHYGQKPIIYTSTAVYKQYIQDNYDNDIWIADLSFPETLPDGKQWKFLQYSFNGKLKGYTGYLPHLDLNVYYGSKWDFATEY